MRLKLTKSHSDCSSELMKLRDRGADRETRFVARELAQNIVDYGGGGVMDVNSDGTITVKQLNGRAVDVAAAIEKAIKDPNRANGLGLRQIIDRGYSIACEQLQKGIKIRISRLVA